MSKRNGWSEGEGDAHFAVESTSRRRSGRGVGCCGNSGHYAAESQMRRQRMRVSAISALFNWIAPTHASHKFWRTNGPPFAARRRLQRCCYIFLGGEVSNFCFLLLCASFLFFVPSRHDSQKMLTLITHGDSAKLSFSFFKLFMLSHLCRMHHFITDTRHSSGCDSMRTASSLIMQILLLCNA
jgi:hypothetical protein